MLFLRTPAETNVTHQVRNAFCVLKDVISQEVQAAYTLHLTPKHQDFLNMTDSKGKAMSHDNSYSTSSIIVPFSGFFILSPLRL
jgi:hypothetical protein